MKQLIRPKSQTLLLQRGKQHLIPRFQTLFLWGPINPLNLPYILEFTRGQFHLPEHTLFQQLEQHHRQLSRRNLWSMDSKVVGELWHWVCLLRLRTCKNRLVYLDGLQMLERLIWPKNRVLSKIFNKCVSFPKFQVTAFAPLDHQLWQLPLYIRF